MKCKIEDGTEREIEHETEHETEHEIEYELLSMSFEHGTVDAASMRLNDRLNESRYDYEHETE